MNFIDQEELASRKKRREHQRRRNVVWNTLTALTLVGTVFLVGFLMLIYTNPFLSFNPFPPATLPALVILPTRTPTFAVMPPTWTPTPFITQTPRPLATEITIPAEASPTTVVPTAAPTIPTSTGGGDFPFALEGNPAPMANIVFHSDADCNWQGVAGQVVDLQGRHLVGVLIRLTGYYNGKTIDMTTLSGGAQAWYGDSGYEFVLGDSPVESKSTLYVQLVDQSLNPISDRVVFDTYPTCDKNLVLINFKQVR